MLTNSVIFKIAMFTNKNYNDATRERVSLELVPLPCLKFNFESKHKSGKQCYNSHKISKLPHPPSPLRALHTHPPLPPSTLTPGHRLCFTINAKANLMAGELLRK